MAESGFPRTRGRPLKYTTQDERRLAKTAQRREQRRLRRGGGGGGGPSVDNTAPVDSTSMHVFYLHCN
jgi:hypothetical protein